MTPPRKATKPTAGSKARRLEAKTRRGAVKRLRGGAIDE
jgi:ribosome-associated protein